MTVVELGAVRVDDGATQSQSQAGVEVKTAPNDRRVGVVEKAESGLGKKMVRTALYDTCNKK